MCDRVIHLSQKSTYRRNYVPRGQSSVKVQQLTPAFPFFHTKQVNFLFSFFLFFNRQARMVFLSFNLCWCLLYCMYIVGYHGWYWLSAIVAKVWVASRLGRGAVVRGDGHCWGSSDGCFLGFRVSMRDWTPRFTLVVTRRVTESADGEEEEPARWEGGRATRHFWYRSWEGEGKGFCEEVLEIFQPMSKVLNKEEKNVKLAATKSNTYTFTLHF